MFEVENVWNDVILSAGLTIHHLTGWSPRVSPLVSPPSEQSGPIPA